MKHKGYFLISLGTIFVIAAAMLLFYNFSLDQDAKAAADEILPKLIQEIHINQQSADGVSLESDPLETKQKELILDKEKYIGIINIPSLQVKLPVLATYKYRDLKIAPCRYAGDPSGKLVIAAHNYQAHFGNINTLSKGDAILFIDVSGTVLHYQVELIEELGAQAVDQMIDTNWDLTLFTCNYVGDKRITVRCSKVKD